MDDLIWLTSWFYKQCDGDWEHGNGVHIGTLDNPGWFLKVSLDETELSETPFIPIEINTSEENWIHCTIEEKIFKGYCGPLNLPELIKIFREWVESD